MVNRISRMAARFYGDEAQLETLPVRLEKSFPRARRSKQAWLPRTDDLDWEDEIRQPLIACAQSPDALTGLKRIYASTRETLETRISAGLRLQNWIFIRRTRLRKRALKVYGTGAPVKFNWEGFNGRLGAGLLRRSR